MAPPPNRKLLIQKRSRSVPYPRPFIKATVFTAFFLLSIVAVITTVIAFAILQDQKSTYYILGSLLVTLFIWTLSLFIRRTASCPLCQGTPYFNSGARTHRKATKYPLISHGMSNILRTIGNQTIRCMYCGEPYDFLKPGSKSLSRGKKGKGKRRRRSRKRRSH